MKLKKIELSEISKRVDPVVGIRNDDWFLVAAQDRERVNTLTAAWGGLGHVCNKPMAIIFIRPQRFTKRFIDASGRFTLTFFDFAKHRAALEYLGRHSGADEPDKIERAGLTVTRADGQPTFEEGRLVLLCKTFFSYPLVQEGFVDKELEAKNYPNHDNSIMYLGEIEAAYEIETSNEIVTEI